jgi:hypothetical protein
MDESHTTHVPLLKEKLPPAAREEQELLAVPPTTVLEYVRELMSGSQKELKPVSA